MPRRNQMFGLMRVAFEWCERDLYDLFRLWFGAMLGITAFVVIALYNLGQYYLPYIQVEINDYSSAVLMSSFYGTYGAIVLLTLLAIWVALLEYTMAFLVVAYHYDNESWEIVNTVRDAWIAFSNYVISSEKMQGARSKQRHEKNMAELHDRLNSLKTDL